MSNENATLLSAPLTDGLALNDALEARCADLDRAIGRLSLLPAHDALTLLKYSFSAPKIIHTLRCTPCLGHETLHKFDDFLKTGLGNITNLSISDIQWVQASLPVNIGGLGIRRVASLALPAFLASAAVIHILQSLLLHKSHHLPDLHRDNLLSTWLTTFNSSAQAFSSDGKQSALDKPVIAADVAAVKSHFGGSFNTARLLVVSAPHSGDWLHALPLATCSLKLENEAIRIAVGLRLGINLREPHQCPCSKLVDARGSHGLSCKRGTARAIHHHQLSDIVRRALVRANIPSVLEPSGLSRGDGKRPDGMTLIPWQGEKMSPGRHCH